MSGDDRVAARLRDASVSAAWTSALILAFLPLATPESVALLQSGRAAVFGLWPTAAGRVFDRVAAGVGLSRCAVGVLVAFWFEHHRFEADVGVDVVV